MPLNYIQSAHCQRCSNQSILPSIKQKSSTERGNLSSTISLTHEKWDFSSGSTGFGFRWVLSTGYLGSSLMAARFNLLLFFSNFSPSFIKAFILGFYQGSGHELVGYFVPDDSMSLLI